MGAPIFAGQDARLTGRLEACPTSLALFVVIALLGLIVRADAQTLPPNYRVTNNVPYVTGGQSRQWMDLYYVPSNAAPTPVVIWIHGGGWNSGNESNPRALALTNFNIAVAAGWLMFRASAALCSVPNSRK